MGGCSYWDTGKRLEHRPDVNRTLRIGEARRIALIEATIRSLADHGITGTTITTISAASKTSRGLIAHYFDSKDELMAAALRHLYDAVAMPVHEAISEPGMTAEERLKKLPVVLYSDDVFSERNRSAFLSFWHETRFNDIVRKTNQDLYDGYVSRMKALFEDAARERGITIDSHAAAIDFIGLSDGMWLGMSIHDTLISRCQAVEACQRLIDRVLAGQ